MHNKLHAVYHWYIKKAIASVFIFFFVRFVHNSIFIAIFTFYPSLGTREHLLITTAFKADIKKILLAKWMGNEIFFPHKLEFERWTFHFLAELVSVRKATLASIEPRNEPIISANWMKKRFRLMNCDFNWCLMMFIAHELYLTIPK